MIPWRFDQGRLAYFQFDEIKRIASGLYSINGIKKPDTQNDHLRKALATYSAQPFLPTNYTVWRNYKRVFGCALLAAEVDGKIVCTDLCEVLANYPNEVDIDEYLGHFATRFYFPSPIFIEYRSTGTQIFPVVAIIKLLVSKYLSTSTNYITIDEIGELLIANGITGLEDISTYQSLSPKSVSLDLRQTRELARFISQLSFLKWKQPRLYLDITSIDQAEAIIAHLLPNQARRHNKRGHELLRLGSEFKGLGLSELTLSPVSVVDTEFTEGKKIRVTHLRTERSSKLRELYFDQVDDPHICDMCEMDTTSQYPWMTRLIEIHHLLPLTSPIRVESGTSSLKDVAGLCPTCHRATHRYYSNWLRENDLDDFRSYEEATDVYQMVKQEVVRA